LAAERGMFGGDVSPVAGPICSDLQLAGAGRQAGRTARDGHATRLNVRGEQGREEVAWWER
jgi:hypothetical protein